MKPYQLLILFFACLPGLQAQTDPVIRMAEGLVSNVVRLEVELEDGPSQSGFGFITNEDGTTLYIVTAAHVTHGQYGDEKYISDPQRIRVSFSNSLEQKSAREITWF